MMPHPNKGRRVIACSGYRALVDTDPRRRSRTHLDAWDKDYTSRGRLWGGAVVDMPVLPEGSLVLELGSGDGKTLSALPGDCRAVAVDVSAQALLLAKRVREDAALIQADAACLPLRECCFDAVFAFHVTGHLLADGRRALAREATRVLKPGGRIFFRDFSEQDMRAGQGAEVEPGTFRRGSGILTHYFREDEVADLFRSHQMELAGIGTRCWKMRIKGKGHLRAEVHAAFFKI